MTTYRGRPVVSRWLNRARFGMWLLGETHHDCPPVSSLSWAKPRGVWLRLPECKARNSWRWLCARFSASGPVYVLRWTLPVWRSS